MKLLGKIVLALLSIIMAASIVLWVLAKNINPDIIKQQVTNQITALTHKPSRIDGTISWQLLPRPGLKFSKILIGKEQLNDEYSLAIDMLHLNLKITPLLRGQIVFSEIKIEGLNALINLDMPQVTNSSVESTPVKNSPINNGSFVLERLLVSDGKIIIKEESNLTYFKNLQVGVDKFALNNTPVTVQFKAKLSEFNSNPQIKAGINFKGRVSLSPSLLSNLKTGISQSSAEGQLILQNILFNRFAINKISTTVKTNKTGIQFNPLTLSLYNGESIGSMNYTFATRQFSLNQTATNLNGKQLMKVVLGKNRISGNLDYSIHATIPLDKTGLEKSAGKGTITIKDGDIYNLNLDQLLYNLKLKLTSLVKVNLPNLNVSSLFTDWDKNKYLEGNTAFKLANIEYQFQNGILTSDSILIQTDRLQIKGKGTINFSNQLLNATLQLSLNPNNTELTLQIMQRVLGGYFPLVVTGTLEQPEIVPDFKIISPFVTQLLIKTRLDKPIKQIQNLLKKTYQ
jgi:AsmA protein